MKPMKNIILGVAALSLGLAAQQTTANAYTTYKLVPRAMRGYYISRTGNSAYTITQHKIVAAIPQADWYDFHVTSVSYSNHYYHIHTYSDMGKRYYTTFKLHHYAKNKFTADGYVYQKVKASTCSYFLNHYNPYSIADN